MAELGEVTNIEASEEIVGTVEPRTLGIDVLEPSDDLPHVEPAYTCIDFVKDFDNLTIYVESVFMLSRRANVRILLIYPLVKLHINILEWVSRDYGGSELTERRLI